MKFKVTILIFGCLICLLCCVVQVNILLLIKFVLLKERKFDKVTKFFPFVNRNTFNNQTLTGIIGNITIVTQLSENRLNILNILAKNWKGPIVAALYIPKNLDVEKKVKELKLKYPEVFERVHMSIMIMNFGAYPMNKLRNFALEQVWTPLILYLDVDFIPSRNIHERIVEFSNTREFQDVKNNKAVLVLPTFHWNCTNTLNFETCNKGTSLFEDHPSQMTTNFSKWRNSNEIYEIQYDLLYEPYVIGSIKMPKYDPTFTLGNDKTSFTYELAALKYKFYVAPHIYIGHFPHQKDVKWALHHAEYSIMEAWHKWHKFVKRVESMYNYRKFCDEYLVKFRNSIPNCVCLQFGCLY